MWSRVSEASWAPFGEIQDVSPCLRNRADQPRRNARAAEGWQWAPAGSRDPGPCNSE